MKERIGLFGGTFDPPHVGHLVLAEWAREELDLDRVLFVPAGRPPHKHSRTITPERHRLAMTRLAVRGQPGLAVSALELARRGPSYTVSTLRALASSHPGARFFLVMGSDNLDDFETWHQPDEIRRRATLAIARRSGSARGRRRRGIVFLENPPLEVSSSLVRRRVRAGRSLRFLVPDPVADYIRRHRLYRR